MSPCLSSCAVFEAESLYGSVLVGGAGTSLKALSHNFVATSSAAGYGLVLLLPASSSACQP
jgi:hypothetical protein